ncbi:hypothetical protein [Novosphingobium lindaniclasticum]|uniref:hypothetical protein n=1 Tax=Novosphingobium lindaniclasticum TaxID=1329895 RepID=UPI0024092872|nr:hypothetical protein [Novosphingobium lindaniclasticum]
MTSKATLKQSRPAIHYPPSVTTTLAPTFDDAKGTIFPYFITAAHVITDFYFEDIHPIRRSGYYRGCIAAKHRVVALDHRSGADLGEIHALGSGKIPPRRRVPLRQRPAAPRSEH